MQDFLFLLDSKGTILHINKKVKEHLGYSSEDLQNEAAIIAAKIIKGETDSCNVPFMTKEGSIIPVESKITLGKFNNKEMIIVISCDIIKRKIVEETLLREKGFTETALNAQLDTFILILLWDFHSNGITHLRK